MTWEESDGEQYSRRRTAVSFQTTTHSKHSDLFNAAECHPPLVGPSILVCSSARLACHPHAYSSCFTQSAQGQNPFVSILWFAEAENDLLWATHEILPSISPSLRAWGIPPLLRRRCWPRTLYVLIFRSRALSLMTLPAPTTRR